MTRLFFLYSYIQAAHDLQLYFVKNQYLPLLYYTTAYYKLYIFFYNIKFKI